MGRASTGETSRFFASAADIRPLRRSTRASRATTSLAEKSDSESESNPQVTYGSDIEDAIKSTTSSPSPERTLTRKRKRTTKTTTTRIPPTSADPIIKTETKTELATSSIPSPTKARRVRKPARATTAATGEVVVTPPSDWEEVYALVKEMRVSGIAANAAVDTMGCERLASPEASVRDRRFHTLVALMLSSQTKDTVNAEAMGRLKTEMPAYEEGAPAGLNLENVLAVDPALLNELIGKVGFHNNKTKYIKQAAVILRDQHAGDIPDTIEGLMALPGVGPKMAHLVMSADNGWGRVEGIGVDVHVHRITNLWGWQAPPSKNPEETRLALQAWLPHDRWKEINWLLVGFGQTVCLPVGRKCGDCTLGLRGLCRSAERKKVLEGRKRHVEFSTKLEDDGVVVKKEEVVDEVIREVVANEAVSEVKAEETASPDLSPGGAGYTSKRPARSARG